MRENPIANEVEKVGSIFGSCRMLVSCCASAEDQRLTETDMTLPSPWAPVELKVERQEKEAGG